MQRQSYQMTSTTFLSPSLSRRTFKYVAYLFCYKLFKLFFNFFAISYAMSMLITVVSSNDILFPFQCQFLIQDQVVKSMHPYYNSCESQRPSGCCVRLEIDCDGVQSLAGVMLCSWGRFIILYYHSTSLYPRCGRQIKWSHVQALAGVTILTVSLSTHE